MVPWNQGHIRDSKEKPNQVGFWNLIIEKTGDYEIELRRWPNEGKVADVGITEEIPPGKPVPGTQSFRARPGKGIVATKAKIEIGGQTKEMAIPEGASHVTFPIKLEAGETELKATFHGDNGEFKGAYFAYVKKL